MLLHRIIIPSQCPESSQEHKSTAATAVQKESRISDEVYRLRLFSGKGVSSQICDRESRTYAEEYTKDEYRTEASGKVVNIRDQGA